MVAPIWLKNITDEAITSPFALVIAQVEAPERGHLTRIAVHSFEETPCEHQKEYIVEYHKHTVLPAGVRFYLWGPNQNDSCVVNKGYLGEHEQDEDIAYDRTGPVTRWHFLFH